MEECPHQEQIAVDLRIAGAHAQHDFHEVDDVLQQAALIGVVVFDPGRGAGELGHELLVQEEAFGQGLQARIGEAAEDLAQPHHQLIDLDGPEGEEIIGIYLARIDLGQSRGDQLDRPLEQLRGPFDADIVAVLEGVVDRVGGVPHPRVIVPERSDRSTCK